VTHRYHGWLGDLLFGALSRKDQDIRSLCAELVMKPFLAAAVAIFISAGSFEAAATTITFGTNDGSLYESVGDTYTESGYQFVNPIELDRWPNGSVNDSDPTPSTGLFTNYSFTTTTISRIDGTPFNLSSMEIDDVYGQGSPSGLLNYTYGFSGGGTGAGSFLVDDVPGFSTILLNLANLAYFSMSPSDQLVYYQFDNVIVSTGANVVPIPATLPLFASALAGLGWVARRRKRAGEFAA